MRIFPDGATPPLIYSPWLAQTIEKRLADVTDGLIKMTKRLIWILRLCVISTVSVTTTWRTDSRKKPSPSNWDKQIRNSALAGYYYTIPTKPPSILHRSIGEGRGDNGPQVRMIGFGAEAVTSPPLLATGGNATIAVQRKLFANPRGLHNKTVRLLTLHTSSSWVLTSTHRYSELPSACSRSKYLSATTDVWKCLSVWLGLSGEVWSRSVVSFGLRHSASLGWVTRNFLTTSPTTAASTTDLSTTFNRTLDITSCTFCIVALHHTTTTK